jgi:hypothetical protein
MGISKYVLPTTIRPLYNNELCLHLTGVRICRRKFGESQQYFMVSGVKYGIMTLRTFALAACYLGYLKVKATGENPVRIPVHLIEELRPLLIICKARAGHEKTLARAVKIMDREEGLRLKRAMGAKRSETEKGLRRRRTLTFDIQDVRLDIFEGRLMHTLEWAF